MLLGSRPFRRSPGTEALVVPIDLCALLLSLRETISDGSCWDRGSGNALITLRRFRSVFLPT